MRRSIVLALAGVLALSATGVAKARTDDHASAMAAIADMKAAVAEIVRIEDGDAVGHPAFLHAAHRALNALVGSRDNGYDVASGTAGDRSGAIGNLDRLLDRTDEPLWTPAVTGAKANALAAAQNIYDAMAEKQMEDYQADLTQALANIALAVGRPSDVGVLGGLSGALGNTTLGVPSNATTVSACSLSHQSRAYGVVAGRLAYITMPRNASAAATPAIFNVSRVAVARDVVILYTRASDETATLCHRMQRVRRVAHGGGAAAVGAASYTAAQARSGAKVYGQNCLSCHGANLQGTAAPGVAGREFLTTAKHNKWTLADLRTLVVENMPLSNPGSLTKKEYADVMAFLLASNCFPAGSKPFPTDDSPAYAKVKIGPVSGAKPANAQLGTCGVK
ncbi:MAG: hypothetical protein NVS3B28_19600 [Candidatus Velthaea sp.]